MSQIANIACSEHRQWFYLFQVASWLEQKNPRSWKISRNKSSQMLLATDFLQAGHRPLYKECQQMAGLQKLGHREHVDFFLEI